VSDRQLPNLLRVNLALLIENKSAFGYRQIGILVDINRSFEAQEIDWVQFLQSFKF
jgi:hypothetical protein